MQAQTTFEVEKTPDFTFKVFRVTRGDLSNFVQSKDIKEFRVLVAEFAYNNDAVEYAKFKQGDQV